MALIFIAENHEYKTIEEENPVKDWISATTFVGHFKEPFDAKLQAEKSSKNKKSKWFGMTPEEIQQAWTNEAKRATDLGTWYHNQRESDLCELSTLVKDGLELPIFTPIEDKGVKVAPSQKLVDGIYPEHMVFLKSAGLCGQSDLVEIVNGYVNITDYKTNKEIKLESYKNWEGVSKKMKAPLSHLDDCNYYHYALQLSLYMYIIIKHNPKLKPGKLLLHHIQFDEVGRDKFDNPITALDNDGNPVLKNIEPYTVPYLKDEIISMIKYLEDFRPKFKKK
jgi:hypothetical protein